MISHPSGSPSHFVFNGIPKTSHALLCAFVYLRSGYERRDHPQRLYRHKAMPYCDDDDRNNESGYRVEIPPRSNVVDEGVVATIVKLALFRLLDGGASVEPLQFIPGVIQSTWV